MKRRLPAGRGQDVVVSGWVHDRDLLLLFVEGMDQLHAEVVFPGQGAQSLAWPFPHFGGIGAEEARAVDNLAIHHRVVLAEMVALDAVAPRAAVGRSAEQGEIVFLRVATLAAVLLHDLKHIFQAHDRHGLDVAVLTQPSR
jgi:hypothetical protein